MPSKDPLETKKERTDSTIYTFDVKRDGTYLGVPRIKELIFDAYKKLGINIEKLRVDQKKAYCNFIDMKMRKMWEGLVAQWLQYKSAYLQRDVDL